MGKTMAEVFETLNEEQKDALYYSLGRYVEKGWDPRKVSKFIWLASTLNDEQTIMVEAMIDEVMNKEK